MRRVSQAENVLDQQCLFPTPADSLIPADCFTPDDCFTIVGLHPFCLKYLMQGRVLPIKVYASDSSVWLIEPWTINKQIQLNTPLYDSALSPFFL